MRCLPAFSISGGIVLVALACGGGSGSTSGGSTGTTTQTQTSFCDAREAVVKKCAPDGSIGELDRPRCNREFDCNVAVLVDPDAYFNCRTRDDCVVGAGDDRCRREAAGNRTVPLSDVCAKKFAECKAAGGLGFDDEVCPMLNAFTDAMNERLAECFAKPCDQIDDCLEVSYEAAAPACD